MPGVNWRKSTFSFSNGNCVEVGADRAAVAVRDTADREGPVLTFGAAAWREFAGQVKRDGRPAAHPA